MEHTSFLRRQESNKVKDSYVYILASRKNGTLYIGVSDDLVQRTWEHKNNVVKGFTEKYGVHDLVYYEIYQDIEEAILREKRMKEWKRYWKIKLINKFNPEWKDLYEDIKKS